MSENITSIILSTTTYQQNKNIQSVDLNNVPWVNNSMSMAFFNCEKLNKVSNINNNVTDMYGAFYNCPNLSEAPTIPNSISSLSSTFAFCTNLVNMPAIPTNVTDMSSTFEYCTNLTGIKDIPNTVVNMTETFNGCTNLVEAPAITENVTTLNRTFLGCTNLTNIPTIPNSVTDMMGTFISCSNLTGDIYINSVNINNADSCFMNTDKDKNVYIPFKAKEMLYAYGLRDSPEMQQAYVKTIPQGGEELVDVYNSDGTPWNMKAYVSETTLHYYDENFQTEWFFQRYSIKDVELVSENNTQTYNSFINAGYSETNRINGVLLMDINSL